MISPKELIDLVTWREGKRLGTSRAQVSEIIGIIADLLRSEPGALACIVKLGLDRRRREIKAAAKSSRRPPR